MDKSTKQGIFTCCLIMAAFGIAGSIDAPKFDEKPVLTAKEQKIAAVLAKNGSDNPVKLAQAIAKSKRPRLATAVTITESNGRNVRGKSCNEKGYFQIREELHGEFNDDLHSQVQKFEEVMEKMIAESDGNLRKALCRYNGDTSGKYAAKVMARVQEVKL